MNALPTLGLFGSLGGVAALVVGGWYWATPDFFRVGYSPTQPGTGFNHQIHAGKLGMDCRYCHTKIEQSPEANIPNVATCYGCHAAGRVSEINSTATAAKVQFIRDAYEAGDRWVEVEALQTQGKHDEALALLARYQAEGLAVTEGGASIEWRRVHKLPDYVRNFPHDVHLTAGVSCYSCHGQVMSMPQVYQDQGMGMGWCLNCHRHPEAALVPPDRVTDLLWVQQELTARAAGGGTVDGAELAGRLWNTPPQVCGACHQ
jgi:hypothetical protein